jgi:hypothetical protein
MRIDIELIRDFLDKQHEHIAYYMVCHSHYRSYHKSSSDLERMKYNLGKDLRYARNIFNKELYGNRARRKPLLYQPLFIPTLEGTRNTSNPLLTLHYNIYLGNLPTILTKEEIQELWKYCWHTKAHQSNDIFITKPLANTQSHLLRYGTKEGQIGNISCWDFENTQIPYSALNAD